MTTKIDNILIKHYAGSLAYGTNLPTSDVDIRGIFCANREFITLPWLQCNEVNVVEEEDTKLYELSKFMQLYTGANPNIIETMFVDESDIIESDAGYELFKENAYELLSSKIAFTFSGYALAQLKRMKGHKKWINNPHPVEAPKPNKFVSMSQNFTPEKIFSNKFHLDMIADKSLVHYGNNLFGVVENASQKVLTSEGLFNVSAKQAKNIEGKEQPIFLLKFNEEEYKNALVDHKNYWTWKNNRNTSRNELEVNYGYDTKHGMHLCRLLRMAEEILTGQGVMVKRPDAKELLEIRAGSWAYDDMIKWAEGKDKLIRGELYANTKLPKKPNMKLAGKILIELQDMYWEK